MGTRFGRRAADGTYEYHDSKESLVAAERRDSSDARSGLFGLIGLLVIQKIVEVHGGGMRLASQPGEGTRITALWPLSKIGS